MTELSKAWPHQGRGVMDVMTQIALHTQPVGQARSAQNFIIVDRESKLFDAPKKMRDWEYSGQINPNDLISIVCELEDIGVSECILVKPLPRHQANEFGIYGFVHVLDPSGCAVDFTGDPEFLDLMGKREKAENIQGQSVKELLENYDLGTLVAFLKDPNLDTGELMSSEEFRAQLETLARQYEFEDMFINKASVYDLIDVLTKAGEFLDDDYDDPPEPEDADLVAEQIAFGGGFLLAEGDSIRNILYECGFSVYTGQEPGEGQSSSPPF